jgi:beta-galactosidase
MGLMIFACIFAGGCASRNGRSDTTIDDGWRFIRRDVPQAKTASFDDSKWDHVRLPHTWNAFDGQDGGGNYYRGPGWYRRSVHLDSGDLRKSIFLHFDGAALVTDVYVNGLSAGQHRGGFGAFCFDISNLVRPGTNIIAVRVDNTRVDDMPPLAGDFTVCGGLYREVHLLKLNPLSISPMDDASPGVYLRQTSVTRDKADIDVLTKLRSAYAEPQNVTVECKVLDAGNHEVASSIDNLNIAGQADSHSRVTIIQPHLWQGVRDPYLYHAVVCLTRDGKLLDRVTQPLGLRYYSVDPDYGFFLNDRHYVLHGVNVHQDFWNMGWAITPKQIAINYSLISELGATVVRLAHYQHPDFEYSECDRRGIVVWAELALVNIVRPTTAFTENTKQQLRELIKQNYNHPSICFWSLYNEPNPSARRLPEYMDAVKQLNELAHNLDDTRLTTGAVSRPATNPLNWVMDITGINRYWGWYSGSQNDWVQWLSDVREEHPTRAIAISEYGAGASIKQHEVYPTTHPSPGGFWHPEEWQGIFHEAAYGAMKQQRGLWGTFVWCMFDFAADHRNEGDHPGRNDKGLVTADRKIKKDAFYYYKANWSTTPFVYITSRRFDPRPPGPTTLKVYSNCISVELFLDGKSLGRKSGVNGVFVWDNVQLNAKRAEVRAIGDKDSKTYRDNVNWKVIPGAPTSQVSQ